MGFGIWDFGLGRRMGLHLYKSINPTSELPGYAASFEGTLTSIAGHPSSTTSAVELRDVLC